MTNTLTSFTKKAIRFWHGVVAPIESNTRRTATNIEAINAARAASIAVVTSVSDSASSVTLLATNLDRFGGSIFNDSTSTLYAKCEATASASDFTIKMLAGEYWEIPFGYTGHIAGIWSSAVGGAARITEYTA